MESNFNRKISELYHIKDTSNFARLFCLFSILSSQFIVTIILIIIIELISMIFRYTISVNRKKFDEFMKSGIKSIDKKQLFDWLDSDIEMKNRIFFDIIAPVLEILQKNNSKFEISAVDFSNYNNDMKIININDVIYHILTNYNANIMFEIFRSIDLKNKTHQQNKTYKWLNDIVLKEIFGDIKLRLLYSIFQPIMSVFDPDFKENINEDNRYLFLFNRVNAFFDTPLSLFLTIKDGFIMLLILGVIELTDFNSYALDLLYIINNNARLIKVNVLSFFSDSLPLLSRCLLFFIVLIFDLLNLLIFDASMLQVIKLYIMFCMMYMIYLKSRIYGYDRKELYSDLSGKFQLFKRYTREIIEVLNRSNNTINHNKQMMIMLGILIIIVFIHYYYFWNLSPIVFLGQNDDIFVITMQNIDEFLKLAQNEHKTDENMKDLAKFANKDYVLHGTLALNRLSNFTCNNMSREALISYYFMSFVLLKILAFIYSSYYSVYDPFIHFSRVVNLFLKTFDHFSFITKSPEQIEDTVNINELNSLSFDIQEYRLFDIPSVDDDLNEIKAFIAKFTDAMMCGDNDRMNKLLNECPNDALYKYLDHELHNPANIIYKNVHMKLSDGILEWATNGHVYTIDYTKQKGSIMMLSGVSGSGKSQLLCQLFGSLSHVGVKVNDYSMIRISDESKKLMPLFSPIDSYYLNNFTLNQNFNIANPKYGNSKDKISNTLKSLNMNKYIYRLDQEYWRIPFSMGQQSRIDAFYTLMAGERLSDNNGLKLIGFDELFANLDDAISKKIANLIYDKSREIGALVIGVDHSQTLLNVSDFVLSIDPVLKCLNLFIVNKSDAKVSLMNIEEICGDDNFIVMPNGITITRKPYITNV